VHNAPDSEGAKTYDRPIITAGRGSRAVRVTGGSWVTTSKDHPLSPLRQSNILTAYSIVGGRGIG